ncbi:MAG: acetylglutamate kinase [Ginsengibacter sp.]
MSNTTHKPSLYIIKIGGNVIDDKNALHTFLETFAAIKENKILVHGGGKIATSLGEKMGIQSQYIDGRRITDDDTIDLVTMAYGGLINKKITAILQSMHCNAIGLTGADNNLLPAKKRPVKTIDFGWVGDVTASEINPDKWKSLLENTMVPVMAPLTHDGNGHILNTNADTIASILSVALSSLYQVKLIFCFEKDGVLLDVNDESSVINNLSESHYLELKDKGSLFAGILPKIDNAFSAVHDGVSEIIIGNSAKLNLLLEGKSGTAVNHKNG